MKKKYISPELEFKRVLLMDNLCASEETPVIDQHETMPDEEDLT